MTNLARYNNARAFLVAPALALFLLACGGGDQDVATGAPAAAADVAEAADPASAPEATSPAAAQQVDPVETQPAETEPVEATEAPAATESAEDAAPAEAAAPVEAEPAPAAAAAVIQQLSADEAIANADANIANLELADSVLDIEVLAVGDGSIQTLRNVVIGDRPVLLWFFSPH